MEVSERTIYRDAEALDAAGVPIYGTAGPEGGYALVESYRTQLTGLTAGEMRALLALSVPEPLARLGLGDALKAALLKLAAALPGQAADEQARIRQRLYVDSTWWRQGAEPVPHLQALYRAVWQDVRVRLRYPLPMGPDRELIVDPYALVAKAGEWHLVYGLSGGVHVRRVAELLDAEPLQEGFVRLEGFDLPRFWQAWAEQREQQGAAYAVTVRVAGEQAHYLYWYLGLRARELLTQAEGPDAQGCLTLRLAFGSFEDARDRLLSFGRLVKVLEPLALRCSIQDFAQQIVALYAG